MSRGKQTKTNKQDLFKEICEQIDVAFNENWKSVGSTIKAIGFESVLCKVAQQTGIPPNHFEPYKKLMWRLLHKSLEGMLLAIEVVNKPTISYRMETFVFLAVNAWELLLKAKIVEDKKDAESINEKDNPKRSVSFQYTIKEVFPDESNPIRLNLERIEDLRNHATHLFIPYLPTDAMLLFQAAILNYERMIYKWFNRSLCERIPKGMMFLVAEFSPEQFDVNSPLLRKTLPEASLNYVAEWQGRVRGDIGDLKESELGQYVMQIQFDFSIVNNPKKADILATLGGTSNAAVAVKYQRPIDRWPISYLELWYKVKEIVPTIKRNIFNKIIMELRIKGNEKYSGYNFRTKKQEETYKKTGNLPKGITCIYNMKTVKAITDEYKLNYFDENCI